MSPVTRSAKAPLQKGEADMIDGFLSKLFVVHV